MFVFDLSSSGNNSNKLERIEIPLQVALFTCLRTKNSTLKFSAQRISRPKIEKILLFSFTYNLNTLTLFK